MQEQDFPGRPAGKGRGPGCERHQGVGPATHQRRGSGRPSSRNPGGPGHPAMSLTADTDASRWTKAPVRPRIPRVPSTSHAPPQTNSDEMGGAPGGAKKLDGAEPRGRWERPLGVPRRAGESPPLTHGRMRVLGGCDGAPHWAASPAEIHSLTGQGRKSETGVLAGLGPGGAPPASSSPRPCCHLSVGVARSPAPPVLPAFVPHCPARESRVPFSHLSRGHPL